ncbi:MAG: VCBS domain-containing protein [Candidatus Thermoplasmatota archaeon]|nr:VCBS domain-containing protein [Candidatus Thermoplasmatota archaeon]
MDSPHNEFVAGTDYTDSITVATADGTPSTVTVTMTGTNDAAVISSGTGSVTEDGTLTTGGTLTISDVDAGQASFVAQPSTAGAYGTFAINSAGAWTYSLNNSNATVQALNAGQVVTEVFSVATSDGGAASVTVNITGSNDVATLASATAALTETNAVLSTGGTLTLNDLDATAATVVAQTTAGTYGSFSIDAAGGWTYTTTDALDQLNAGQVVTEVFSVATSDGGAASVTVNITGSNDVATLASATAALTETNAVLSTGGTLTLNDLDATAATVVAQTTAGTYGSFSIDAAGGWTYTTTDALDQLNAGQVVTEVFSVATSDGGAASVTVNITGSNDVAVLSATTTPIAVVEAANAVAQDLAPISGSFALTDMDVGDTLTASVVGNPTVLLNGASFTLPGSASALTAAGAFSLTSPGLSTGANQSVGYTYDPAAANLDFLRAGQNLAITYAVKVNDGMADSATQNVTFTLTGTNDAPVLSAIAAPASVAELANASAQDIAPINGILSVSDADVGDTLNALVSGTPTLVWSGGALTASQITTLTAALVSGKLTFGSAVLSDGAAKSIGYTWDPTAANLDFLARGQTLTVTYGVKVNDGTVDSTTQNVTFTITGTNDAPVANPDTLAATEDTAVTYTAAQLLGNDTDAEGNPLSIASVTSGVGGSVVLNGNGTVTFTPNANFSGTASFSYVASDGSATSNSANVTVNVAAVADSPQLITPGQLNALVAGVSSISTTAAVSNARLAGAIGLPSATLNSFDPPPGPGTNDPGTVNVNDGTLTNYNYTLSSGTSVVFNWAFTNGENLAGEINNGFNDIVVLVITNPNGTQTSTLITSSEQAGPATNTSGAYTFTAATAGSYQFSWLVLNGTDTAKDSSLTISNIAFQTGAITFGTPVDFPIATALVDTDGSETLSVTIAGVPAGAAFSAGTNLGGGIWSFTSAQLNGLIFLPADGYTGTINLTVTSTATETSNGSTASTTQTVAVTVAETTSTITGTDGNNNLTGTASNDHIQGLAGNDTLSGGAGNDLIYGGTGNDTLVGGTGNDTLIGGLGADTFKWQLNDGGSMASPATDTVKDFDNVNNSDKLDLRDLLVGESHAGTDPGNLVDYLHFEVSGSNTIIQISSSGGFSGGYSAGATDQRIVLNNTDLTGGGTLSADQQIIQDLLSKGKLITD